MKIVRKLIATILIDKTYLKMHCYEQWRAKKELVYGETSKNAF